MVMSLESLRDIPKAPKAINLTKPKAVMLMVVDVTTEAKTLTMTIGGESITYHVAGYE